MEKIEKKAEETEEKEDSEDNSTIIGEIQEEKSNYRVILNITMLILALMLIFFGYIWSYMWLYDLGLERSFMG